jgi:opacity protein-like surface antigen
MNKQTIKRGSFVAALALGAALSASAQSAQNAAGAPAPADPGPGLVGTNYSELTFGYQRQGGEPKDLRDFELTTNGSVFRNDTLGVDANFVYDYLYGYGQGYNDHRNEAQLGLTGFLMETWGKPFVTADAGVAWQDAGGLSQRGFGYTATAGVEFQALKNLALTPFLEYQAEPRFRSGGLPAANFPDHVLYYGVKATYRINRDWSASLGADLDGHSANDWGIRAGVSYHF